MPWKPRYSVPLTPSHTSQRLNDITTIGLQTPDANVDVLQVHIEAVLCRGYLLTILMSAGKRMCDFRR
jgi:hypothetical protein